MCLFPKTIRNPRYKPNKKNGGIVPEWKDNRLLYINVPCNKCMECARKRGNEWRTRLMAEIKHDPTAVMVTLTLNTESFKNLYNEAMRKGSEWGYDLDNNTAKIAVRRFYERYRKAYGVSLKHWLITELGSGATEHMHLHGIVWTEHKDKIADIWGYGFVHTGQYVNEHTIKYIMKYFLKQDDNHKHFRPKLFCSPGLGKHYINTPEAKENAYNGEATKEYMVSGTGHKIGLSTYYRRKLYTDEQREALRLMKINSPYRYVDKTRVNVKYNFSEYKRLVAAAWSKNDRLEYGPNHWDIRTKEQEHTKRTQLQKKRLDSITEK